MTTTRSRSEEGFTVVEAAIAVTVLTVSLLSLWTTIMYAARSNLAAEQKRKAIDSAWSKIEEMKSREFGSLIHEFGPKGTTGNRFAVTDLDDEESRAGGRITFLVDETDPSWAGADARAMDLNGDGDAKDSDTSEDYSLLPVRITVTWEGPFGEQSVALTSVLARGQ